MLTAKCRCPFEGQEFCSRSFTSYAPDLQLQTKETNCSKCGSNEHAARHSLLYSKLDCTVCVVVIQHTITTIIALFCTMLGLAITWDLFLKSTANFFCKSYLQFTAQHISKVYNTQLFQASILVEINKNELVKLL